MSDSCYFCDETECLETHHIVPRRFDGSDNEENLVDVCPTCHRKLEKLYDNSFYDRIGASGAGSPSYGIFECLECGDKFIEDAVGRFPSCPVCKNRDGEFLRLNTVSDNFVEFGNKGDIDSVDPVRDYFVWYKDKNEAVRVVNHESFGSRIEAQERAWKIGMNEKVENAGFLVMVSLFEVKDIEHLTDFFL